MSSESLYIILGVDKKATDDEMKKAYKKQALRLHPDRNFANVDEATKLFAKVQAAYDVLSDPQERAWYDAHGLTGAGRNTHSKQTANIRITTSDELQMYFDPLLYISMSHDDFFQLVDELFRQLNTEEKEAYLDANQERRFELPGFGDRLSAWAKEVKPFYDTWSSFSSVKTFAWCDVYRTTDAPDRRIRRNMENKNKKIRDTAKKEFNETVRALVSFIKKRDPRALINIKRDRNKKAQAEMASKAQAARDRKANANAKKRHEESYQEQDWNKVQDEDFFAAAAFPTENAATDNQSEDDDSEKAYECVVCDRVFHTQKMLVAHEMSRKHFKAVENLKREMRNEGVTLGLDSESDFDNRDDHETTTNREPSDTDNEENKEDEHIRPTKTINVFDALNNDSGEDIDEESDDEIEEEETRKSSNAFTALSKSSSEESDHDNEESEVNEPLFNNEKSKKQPNAFATLNDSSDDDYQAGEEDEHLQFQTNSTPEPINNRTKSTKKYKGDDALNELLAKLEGNTLDDDSDDDFRSNSSKKVGKAKQRKEKRINAANAFANKCSVCQTDFTTRNKLFEHARISGHAGGAPKKSKGNRK
ncbi:DnaJ-domain-containing protein [Nadsonia fulvescens var. elongata DSM 6958]|uniref:DnaJ-domain-containing protein n=1 Tax=Nadsonia fulvescens var. elongata DSM 6958 TaxID=857566 RepID=A0A1E3PMG9_9ASCO|nr:DnaJ-domain-containing protein [Nadsonia fulvescens var. elongata DSM 6958]